MSEIQSLEAQAAELAAKIASAKAQVRSGAIAQVKQLMLEHGLTAADLGDIKPASKAVQSRTSSVRGVTIVPKYRNQNGETWTGRGLQPRWLKAALAGGATLEQFRIAA